VKEPVTMKEIALRAGVSQATVSLSLSNHPRIPVQTRDRIQSLARQVGYEPNPFVSALMRSRRRGQAVATRPVLAVVCLYERADGWRNAASDTVRRTLEGVLAAIRARGYEGQEVWIQKDGMSNERFSEVLRARGIQGILLGPLAPGKRLPCLEWKDFSVVRVGVPLAEMPMRTVCHDNYAAAHSAVQQCLKLGYRRPGLILLQRHNLNLQYRWQAGFLAATALLPPPDRIAPWSGESWPEAAELERWLKANRADVILTPAHDAIARALAATGRRIPQDIGLASLACPDPEGPVSGIFQNGRLIGASAANLLIDLVERHERGFPPHPTALMVEGRWNPGRMLRAP
jgi:DNA-binding LacI/PurR family transcriptional regulator